MHRHHYFKFTSIIISVFIFTFSFLSMHCFEFDRNYFGVVFSPYVKTFQNGEVAPSYKLYTMENVKTMLTVISGRFSKVIVKDNFAFHDRYVPNITYHYGSYASVYSGEAAALINQKKGEKILTLFYEVSLSKSTRKAKIEISLVLEAAEKANKIYPGTVQGLIFGKIDVLAEFQNFLHYSQAYKEKVSRHGLTLGARQACSHLTSVENETLDSTQNQITVESDFIICGTLIPGNPEFGPEDAFGTIAKDFLSYRELLTQHNSKAQVMAMTEWSSSNWRKWETAENQREYWESANKWASEHKYTIYLSEAFDNPWRMISPSAAHRGWWKLEENAKINSVEGYVEKSLGSRNAIPNEDLFGWNGTYTIIIVVACVLVTLTLFGFVGVKLCRRDKSTVLSLKEVRDFLLGSSNDSTDGGVTNLEMVTKSPYDTSLEIPKEKLKIDNNYILGMGQFGCVFKAQMESGEGQFIEVAVKIAKKICPPTALDGLLSEIKIMSYLGKHPNIVVLQGAYTAELIYGVVYVATEFCSLGSLEGYLRKDLLIVRDASMRSENNEGTTETTNQNRALCITEEEMIRWSQEIASGMAYLESKHVVHADLATRNVLLTSDKIAKITDFGLSRRMYNYMNYVKTKQEPMPWRWMAVESLKRMEFSSKSDVWSYGVTLWEIFSKGDTPYPGLAWSHGFVNELMKGLRPDFPPFASHAIYLLMKECWSLDIRERPNFNDLDRKLAVMLQKRFSSNIADTPTYLCLDDDSNL